MVRIVCVHVQATPCVGMNAASPINIQVSTFLAHPWPSLVLAAADQIRSCIVVVNPKVSRQMLT